MKHTLLYFVFGIFLLAACQQEETPETKAYGYLSISDIDVQSVNESIVTTRSGEEPLTVEIWQDGSLLQTLDDTADKVRLETGSYTLKAYSSSYETSSSWTNSEKGEPVYYAEQTFAVEADQTTSVEVSVPMINFGVTFRLPEEYVSNFPSYTFTATVGGRSIRLQEGETAYFSYAEGTTFDYTLNATNSDSESFTQSGSYGGADSGETVAAGTLYVVTYNIETQNLEISE